MSEINTLYNSYTTPKLSYILYFVLQKKFHIVIIMNHVSRFKDLLQYMEAYLHPITQQLDSIFWPSQKKFKN